MAKTYTVGKALTLLQTQMKIPDLTPFAATIADEAMSFIWDAFDWRGSLVELAPFFLLPREQDYGPPLSAVPADFLLLRKAYLRNVDSYQVDELEVKASLPMMDRYGTPEAISYEPEIGKFRVHPVPPSSWGASQYQLEGRYKKTHAKVTPENINSTVLPWDDQYFDAYRRTLKWKWLDEIGSPLAGQVSFFPDGSVAANGAAATAWNAIMGMARREGLGDAPEQLVPEADLFQ